MNSYRSSTGLITDYVKMHRPIVFVAHSLGGLVCEDVCVDNDGFVECPSSTNTPQHRLYYLQKHTLNTIYSKYSLAPGAFFFSGRHILGPRWHQ